MVQHRRAFSPESVDLMVEETEAGHHEITKPETALECVAMTLKEMVWLPVTQEVS